MTKRVCRTHSQYENNPDSYGSYTSVPPFVPGVTDPNNLTPADLLLHRRNHYRLGDRYPVRHRRPA